MIIVDANVFLRYLVQPATTEDEHHSGIAAALVRQVQLGQETIFTTDAVIAEVVFILSSKRHYHVPRPEVAALLTPILSLPGCKVPHKTFCLRALDLWAARPRLSFVDALVTVWAIQRGVPLASFDADLNRTPGLIVWRPAHSTDQAP
jgi:predicted nucleic acid-binding protein